MRISDWSSDVCSSDLDQVAAYRSSQEPDVAAYDRICAQLRELALEQGGQTPAPTPMQVQEQVQVQAAEPVESAAATPMFVSLSRVSGKDADALAGDRKSTRLNSSH